MRENNCLTNFLDHVYFATQNLVGDKNQFAAKITKPPPAEITEPQPCVDKNQFAAKITKPPPAEITKPNHVLASTGTGFHESVKQCKSLSQLGVGRTVLPPNTCSFSLFRPDLVTFYFYVRETGCLTNFLGNVCFANQNLVGDKNQFAGNIMKPPAAAHMNITKPQPCAGFNLASI